MDRDGKPDLVVTNFDESVSVLLGRGDGTFQEKRSLAAGLVATSLSIADLNGDGWPDLSLVSPTFRPVLFLGSGDGEFQPVRNLVGGVEGFDMNLYA